MATIKSQMVLNDGMSAVLKKITNALDLTLASFEQMQRASDNAVDVSGIKAVRGAIAGAGDAVDEMAESYRRAAQEERLNQNMRRGKSVLEGVVKKVTDLVGKYINVPEITNFAISSMKAADTQINAQIQLKTVLGNMGAEDGYNTLLPEVSGGAPEMVLGMDTSAAADNYSAFASGVAGDTVIMDIQTDTARAETAYDAILAKASEIQSKGIYSDETMIAGAAEFAAYF